MSGADIWYVDEAAGGGGAGAEAGAYELRLPTAEAAAGAAPAAPGAEGGGGGGAAPVSFVDGLFGDDVQGLVARQVYGAGAERAKGIFDFYANIDLIRPYFDVEPRDVALRLLQSLVPYPPAFRACAPPEEAQQAQEPHLELPALDLDALAAASDGAGRAPRARADLYGPLMLCFTLSSVLLYGLKLQRESAVSHMQQGTLLSTALAVCFTYWTLASAFYYFLCFMVNTNMTLFQVASSTGYAFFGICVSLLVHCFFSVGYLDTVTMIVFGGLSAMSLAATFFSRTPQKKHGVVIGLCACGLQLLFLVYLKVFYTAISENDVDGVEGMLQAVTSI